MNNYGVWEDEFTALGLQDTLDRTWDDAACWFGEGQEVRVGRRYGRVCRRRLRSALLQRCVGECAGIHSRGMVLAQNACTHACLLGQLGVVFAGSLAFIIVACI